MISKVVVPNSRKNGIIKKMRRCQAKLLREVISMHGGYARKTIVGMRKLKAERRGVVVRTVQIKSSNSVNGNINLLAVNKLCLW